MSKDSVLQDIAGDFIQKQKQKGTEQPWLAAMGLRYGQTLLTRFQYHYQSLITLPRRTRRKIQRRWAMSLAAVALLLALSGAPVVLPVNADAGSGNIDMSQFRVWSPVSGSRSAGQPQGLAASVISGDTVLSKGPAATIVVNGNNPATDCTLADAIVAANTDTATGNCIAGTGDDILDIQVNVNLTAASPVINSNMTLEGNGNTIAGDDTFGPLLSVDPTGDMTLNNATVTNGSGANYSGGIFNNGGTVSINDSTISNNYAYYVGGGIQNYGGTATISGSVITGNSAAYGGGLRNEVSGTMTINDSTISGNSANGGAAISNTSYGTMQINNSTVSGNDAAVYSGGIDNVAGATLTVNNSTISSNSNDGTYGGGIYAGFTYPTNLAISDSTITGNSVNGPGAGVWMAYGQGSVSRSLISGNSGVGLGDELFNTDTLTIDNYNLFGHDGITTTQAVAGVTPGASDILATSDGTVPTALSNILNTLLQNNGGSTDTHSLPLASPARDGVADGSCAAGNEDQRHLPRGAGVGMGGPLCDIGAFELQNQSPTDVNLTGFGGESNGGLLTGLVTAVLITITSLATALHIRKSNKD